MAFFFELTADAEGFDLSFEKDKVMPTGNWSAGRFHALASALLRVVRYYWSTLPYPLGSCTYERHLQSLCRSRVEHLDRSKGLTDSELGLSRLFVQVVV